MQVVRGEIEPPPATYQIAMLPLQHRTVGKVGVEPTRSCSQGTRVAVTLHPVFTFCANSSLSPAELVGCSGCRELPPPADPPHCQTAPLSFGPDNVWDYELGEKARFLDNRLTINGDIYYIVWNGVQVTPLLSCGYEYDTNGGNGRSFGPELEVDAKLTDQWSVYASAAYTDAQITDVAPGYKFFIQNYQPPAGAGVASCLPGASSCTVPILNVPKETASL